MRILALDSATSQGSIALVDGGIVRARRALAAAGQGDGLPLEVAALLRDAGTVIAALDRLAVAVGPGRFTGLRAGLAFMRGLALATGKPLIGVTTLEAVAVAARAALEPDERLLAVIDSRRAELFFQLYASDGSPLAPPFAARPEALAAVVGPEARLLLAGEEVERIAPLLAPLVAGVRTLPLPVDAADIARLAAVRALPEAPPAPLYIHPPATTAPRRIVGLVP